MAAVSYTHLDVYKRQSESVIMRHEAKEKQRGRKKITIAVLVSIALCTIAIFTALFLLPINIAYEPVKIDFPFEVEAVSYTHLRTAAAISQPRKSVDEVFERSERKEPEAVSYTHLDVYKRQIYDHSSTSRPSPVRSISLQSK